MGWKTVKDHYGIRHIVKMVDEDLHIGSSFVGDLVVVRPDGSIAKGGLIGDDEIKRIRREISSDPATFVNLMAKTDAFERSIPVYTWSGADIVEDACEEESWPHVTHSGQLMYDNTHSTDRHQVISWAKADAAAARTSSTNRVQEIEAALKTAKAAMNRYADDLRRLEDEHPDPMPET